MKKWSQYLKENSKKILSEFNKKDEKAVMEDENRFSVAFEIEMESASGGNEDDMYEAEQEARVAAAEGHFGWSADSHFTDDIMENSEPESIGAEQPEDGDELFTFYYNETDINPEQYDIIRVAVASQGDEDAENVLDVAFVKIVADPLPFLKAVTFETQRRSEFQDLLGWGDEQMTLGFEVEGGKHFPLALEKIGTSKQAVTRIIDFYVINAASLKATTGPREIFPKSKNPYNIETFLKKFCSENLDYFVDKANELMDDEVDSFKGRWGYGTIGNILSDINYPNPKWWGHKILKRYHDHLESKVEEAVQSKLEEFRDDPVQYLEDMGYEDYQWFDVDEWRESYGGSGQYGCDVHDLEAALETYFPSFMSKYQNSLKFEEDGSLTCGIEFSQDDPPYMTGLDGAIQYLEDFFDEYNNQSYFSFTSKTGLHTNIGYLTKEGVPVENYNLFKALMFLNHRYATTGVGFPTREHSDWAGDLKGPALTSIIKFIDDLPKESQHEDVLTKDNFMKLYLSKNFEELGNIMTGQVIRQAQRMGSKSIGFNVNYTKRRNYIEFRYPGKLDPTLKSMTKALKYYSFIVKAAADTSFKQKEYIKDLVGFLNNLKSEKISVLKLEFFKTLKKGNMLLDSGSSSLFDILVKNFEKAIEVKEPKDGWQWDGHQERVLARTSNDLVYDAIVDMGGNPLARLIHHGGMPVFYKGVVKEPKNMTVRLIKYKQVPEAPYITQYSENQNPQIFQREVNDGRGSGRYKSMSHVSAPTVAKMKRILQLLLENKDSLKISKEFIDLSKSMALEDTDSELLKKYDISWISPNNKLNIKPEKLDSENDLQQDSREISQIFEEAREHFKRWKF